MYSGIINKYVRKPKNLTTYTAFRGVTDWTQIGQFDQFETGYSFLSVVEIPKFLRMLADWDPDGIGQLIKSFTHMLEYEFRGLDGLPDISSESSTISNGIQDVNMISKVTTDSSITITSTYYEKAGGLITRFSEYYLTGIKDPRSEAKTYHGLIVQGDMEPSYENEIFTLLYYVTDNTYLCLERAFLFANAQLTKADMSMYNTQRGEISNREYSIEFQCYPIWGEKVDYAANEMLKIITGAGTLEEGAGWKRGRLTTTSLSTTNGKGTTRTAVLDSGEYNYQILNGVNDWKSDATNIQANGSSEDKARFTANRGTASRSTEADLIAEIEGSNKY